MTKKIFQSILLVASAVMLACLVLIMGVLYDYFGTIQKKQLKAELDLAVNGMETAGEAYLERVADQEERFTYIDTDGTVLFDSFSDAPSMENHADREEVRAAMERGSGESVRYSRTLTQETVYFAKRLSDDKVLRISGSHMTAWALLIAMVQPILVVIGIALVFSYILADRMSKKIVKPMNDLDLDKPLENETYDELAPLLTRIERQQRQIRKQKEELAERKKEFRTVIRNMREGLVLLDADGSILSINPSASVFLHTDVGCVGSYFLSVERGREINSLIDKAREQGSAELMVSREGREYQLNTTRIEENGQVFGIVLLIFDVTEKVFAERNRREFTANVTHELKTPLHTIMGHAELIGNGIVSVEKLPEFAGHIRSEAARLVSLIEDILRLSKLDERAEMPVENVALKALAEEEISALTPVAEKRGIGLHLEGDEVTVCSVCQLIHEIVGNLCDNAVKYNKDGGEVHVAVGKDGQGAYISVKDTGIGIPAEHQTRIFERFYRVDKSHSREIGGTGLGLSIVKHAVQYLGGMVDLSSEEGEGTTIAVHLPDMAADV